MYRMHNHTKHRRVLTSDTTHSLYDLIIFCGHYGLTTLKVNDVDSSDGLHCEKRSNREKSCINLIANKQKH